MFDLVRIDHFRGFVGYWQVPAGHKTARQGRWVKAPAHDFFDCLQKTFPRLPFIAEDLGFITPDVVEVMQHYNLPGMKVLMFAFGEDDPRHPYLPPNYPRRCVAYTGTHDTNTVRGWLEKEAGARMKARLFRYLGREVSAQDISWELVRRVMDSRADLVVFPMQDFLGLGQASRMNRPGRRRGNWIWRLRPHAFSGRLAERIIRIVRDSARA
jgi:4-alpha-glucanotransferase